MLFACWSAFDASLDPNSLPVPPAPGSTGAGSSAATGAAAIAGGGSTRPGSAKADKTEREKMEKDKGGDGSTALSGAVGAMPAAPQPPAQLPPAPPPAVNAALALQLQWALVHTLLGALEARSRFLAIAAGQRPPSAIAAAPVSTRPNTPTPAPVRERADSGVPPVFPLASQEAPKDSARQLSTGETFAGLATNGSRTELTSALSLFPFASDEEHMISVDDFSDLVPIYEQLSDNWLILFR